MPFFLNFRRNPGRVVLDREHTTLVPQRFASNNNEVSRSWVNRGTGSCFSLVEAPDLEACRLQQIGRSEDAEVTSVEIDAALFKLLTEQGKVQAMREMSHHECRCVMAIELYVPRQPINAGQRDDFGAPSEIMDAAAEIVQRNNGQQFSAEEPYAIFFFDCLSDAIHAAFALQGYQPQQPRAHPISDDEGIAPGFRIGLSAVQGEGTGEESHREAVSHAIRLATLAHVHEIFVTAFIYHCSDWRTILRSYHSAPPRFRVLNGSEEVFVKKLFEHVDVNLSDENFNIDKLSYDMGISHPQLYRKIISLAGKSPNELVRDLRMKRALQLLKFDHRTISEIAWAVGYSNPSYFTKCFALKFGCTPSKFVESVTRKGLHPFKRE